jgi:hypothetical protein
MEKTMTAVNLTRRTGRPTDTWTKRVVRRDTWT